MATRAFIPAAIALLFVPIFASASTCPNLYRNLSFGSRGDDVVELQNFLIFSPVGNRYLNSGNNSGYFGRLTKEAVISFQGTQSLPMSGYVGPLTRARIASICADSTKGSAYFSASPTSGNAPLTVLLSTHNLPADPAVDDGVTISINFGDGTQMALDKFKDNPQVTHTYASGTYIATLVRSSNPCVKIVNCNLFGPPVETLGTVTITVSGSGNTSANFSATPTYGKAPLTVTFSAYGIDDTNHLYTIDPGDGTSYGGGLGMFSNTKSGPPTHTYTSAGTYTAKLLQQPEAIGDCMNCPQPPATLVGTVTITVTGGSTDNPNASLRLERYNNYSAQAYFTGCKAPFSLDWGDGRAPRVYNDIPYANGSGSFVTSSEYLLYEDGVYTVTLTCGATKIQKTFIASGGGITTTNKEPKLRYFLGGNPLKVQLSFTAPSGCSSYNLSWGDGSIPITFGGIPNGTEKADCSNMVTKTFQHTFSQSGNYSIGFSAGATSRMVAASISGTEPTGPVCGAPPFRCDGPPGTGCAQVMPQPRTYASLAVLRADGAAVVYAGSCEDTMISN